MKLEIQFAEVLQLIRESKNNAYRTVNTELINLYWQIGQYISKRIEAGQWGESIVSKLSEHIEKKEPGVQGFSDKNLWRMRQFYESYRDHPKISPLVRELSWTNNLIILSSCKTIEEREFYLRLCKKEQYSKRELERQINSSFYERAMMGNKIVSPPVRELEGISEAFKDHYVFEFLQLPEKHNENELQKGLISKMKNFILELGKDFSFIGEEFRVQVGNSDFEIDLLFYHRGLQCLVAFELKAEGFRPEHLGQLNFYLEALDRDVKKQHENPSIGILLCKQQDSEVVKYALSRSLSPSLVAAYQTQLPDKKLLQQKIRELFRL